MIGLLAALMIGLLIIITAGLYSTVVAINWPDSWPGAVLVALVAMAGVGLAFYGGRGLWRKLADGAN